jgi:hypothetical protein
MSEHSESRCPRCGSKSAGLRHCLNCGYQLAISDSLSHHGDPRNFPASEAGSKAGPKVGPQEQGSTSVHSAGQGGVRTLPAPAPEVLDVVESGTGGRQTRRLRVGLIVAALLAGVGGTYAIANGADSGDVNSEATTSSPARPSVVTSETASPAGSPSEEPQSDEPEDQAARSPQCWDGKRVTDLTKCTKPTGVKGLRWVFPGFRDQFRADDFRCRNRTQRQPDTQTSFGNQAWSLVWACAQRTSAGRAFVSYARVGYPGIAMRWYDLEQYPMSEGSKFTEVLAPSGELRWLRWEKRAKNGAWSITMLYHSQPFAITVRAPNKSAAEGLIRSSQLRLPMAVSGLPNL